MAAGIAERMGKKVVEDASPYMIASAIVSATRWLRISEVRTGQLPSAEKVISQIRPTLQKLGILLETMN